MRGQAQSPPDYSLAPMNEDFPSFEVIGPGRTLSMSPAKNDLFLISILANGVQKSQLFPWEYQTSLYAGVSVQYGCQTHYIKTFLKEYGMIKSANC